MKLLSVMAAPAHSFLDQVVEHGELSIVSAPSLDAIMASSMLMYFGATSELRVSLKILTDLKSQLAGEKDALTVAIGTGYPTYDVTGSLYFIDYAPAFCPSDKCTQVVGSLSRYTLGLLGLGSSFFVDVAEMDPLLVAPNFLLPADVLPIDIYSMILPPIPRVTGNKEILSSKIIIDGESLEGLLGAASRAGFSYKTKVGARKAAFYSASSIQQEIFRDPAEAVSQSLYLLSGKELSFGADEELLSALAEFFSESDDWLIIRSQSGTIILLTRTLDKRFSLGPAIPVFSALDNANLPLFVFEPLSDELTKVWGIGTNNLRGDLLNTVKALNGVAYYSGRLFVAEFPIGAVDLANYFDKKD